jgi:hypothetical protein
MSKHTVYFLLPLLCILALPGLASGTPPLSYSDPDAVFPLPSRDTFYCQNPEYTMLYNISSGFDAEFADDIPVEWIGNTITSVTLWLGEWWYGGGPTWTDPLGVRVNFYQESCPPELDPYLTFEVAWDALDKTLVYNSGGSRVYEINVTLSTPVTVGSVMSLGATALIDWGQDEPFTGLCATPMHVSYGACSAYLDGDNWGYERWTALDFFTGIPQDLGYCLTGQPTAVPDNTVADLQLSAQPNPFNPRTTIHCSLALPGPVTLRVYDLAGRTVATLLDGWREAGEVRVEWDGLDQEGNLMPSGVYLYELRRGKERVAAKMMMMK